MRHIYISFEPIEAAFVKELRVRLEGENLRIWDNDSIPPGENAPKIIERAIRNASIVLVIMSPTAKSSEVVTHEWAFALGLGLRVFPIIIRSTPLHPRLSILKPLDFTENPITEAKWTQLIDWLKKLQQEQDTKTHASIENMPFISPTNLSGAWIIQTKGPDQGKSWHLNKPVIIIGRDVTNDIFVDNRSVSRRHAMMTQSDDGTYVFEDLSSTNGSVVNGERIIEPIVLNNGDTLLLGGEVSLRFHITE